MDEMERQVARHEWEIEAIKRNQMALDERVVAIRERMDAHHTEVMAAIGSLRDDRARSEGAMEERLQAAQRTRDRMKMTSVIIAIVGALVALGWIGDARGDMIVKRYEVIHGSETRRGGGTTGGAPAIRREHGPRN